MNPQALFLAIAFWAINPPAGTAPLQGYPCLPGGPQISYYDPQTTGMPTGGYVIWREPRCTIHIANPILSRAVEVQCAVLIHELGHSLFRLEHSDDPESIMHNPPAVIPWCRVRIGGIRARIAAVSHHRHRHLEGSGGSEVPAGR